MKLEHLFESMNWKDIRDPANRWLAKYTYENTDKWPSTEIFNTLVKRYPSDRKIIYRGMNFRTKEQYDEFMATLDNNKTKTIEFNGISSWAPTAEEAEAFAITQPSYSLNFMTMQQYGEMEQERERVAGYRGIIIMTVVQANQGIDVTKSKLGHEPEIIMPKGKIRVKIYKLVKKFKDHLNDKDYDINNVVLNATKEDTITSEPSIFNYVMHHHINELNDKARAHLFNLYKPEKAFQYEAEEYHDFIRGKFQKTDKVRFYYWVPYKIFDLYLKGVFTNPKQINAVKSLARKTLKEGLPVIEKYIISATEFRPDQIEMAAKICGEEHKVVNLMRRQIGREYQNLMAKGREINNVKDQAEFRDAIQRHADELKKLLSKISG